SFIQKHWSPIEQEMAEIWIKDELQKYRVDSPMNLGTTPLTKLSDSACVKLGLIDMDGDLDFQHIRFKPHNPSLHSGRSALYMSI
ncbi:hypothetical protein BS47DRAFT_1340187, partial [Hydnum rufescens UP504]